MIGGKFMPVDIINDTVISAQKFYESCLIKQRERVNSCIRDAMKGTDTVLKLPFDTYPALDDELFEKGWIFDDDASDYESAVYSPDHTAVCTGTNDFISAKEFYEATLKNQWEMVKEQLIVALESGEALVKLPFDTYPVINEKMKNKGWAYEEWKPASGPKKKCAFFYPVCGYEDE